MQSGLDSLCVQSGSDSLCVQSGSDSLCVQSESEVESGVSQEVAYLAERSAPGKVALHIITHTHTHARTHTHTVLQPSLDRVNFTA